MRFVAADASSTSLKWAALLEFGLIVTQLGTAVVLYPIARRQSETIALGYVTARTIESVFAAIGLISMLSLVSVISAMDGASGGEAVALQTQGDSLAHAYEWAFEWGPGLVAGIGNGLLLGYLMYTSALVPPRLALLGLIGGPILILSFLLILAGVYENGEGPSALLTLPEAAWELSLGVYCAWKGFRTSSPLAEQARRREPAEHGSRVARREPPAEADEHQPEVERPNPAAPQVVMRKLRGAGVPRSEAERSRQNSLPSGSARVTQPSPSPVRWSPRTVAPAATARCTISSRVQSSGERSRWTRFFAVLPSGTGM
jgi:hypothetical protein